MIHKYYNTTTYSNKSLLRPEYWNIERPLEAPDFIPRIYTNNNRKNTNTAPIYNNNDVFISHQHQQKRKFVQQKVNPSGPLFLKVPSNFRPPQPTHHVQQNKIQHHHHQQQQAQQSTAKKLKDQDSLSQNKANAFKQQASSSTSSQRSSSVGLAEQLRRSRESNTFALIDSELSKSPLGRIRELYLSLRGVNSNNGNVPRTTKKANLSAVHTIVRFRIKEYLMEMREHSRKLAETLVSHDPSYNSVSDLLTPYPCTKDCQHCDKFQCRLELRRTLPKKFPSPSTSSSVSSFYQNPIKTPSLSTTRSSSVINGKTPFDLNNNNNSSSKSNIFNSNENIMDIKPTLGITSSESNKSFDYSSPPDFPSPSDPQSSDFEDMFYSSTFNENEVMLTSLSSNSNDDVKPPQPLHIKRTHNDSYNPSKNYMNDCLIDSLNWDMDFTQTAVDIDNLMGPNGFDFPDCDDIADSLCPVSTDEELPVLVS